MKRALVVIAVGAIGVGVFVLLARFGDSDQSSARPCTNDATATAIREHNRDTQFRDLMFIDDEAQCRLRRAVVTEDEVPEGLKHEPLMGHSLYEVNAACSIGLPEIGSGTVAHFVSRGDDYRYLAHEVVSLGEGDGIRLFAAMRHSCALLPAQDSFRGGDIFPYRALGDDTLAVRQLIDVDEALTSIYMLEGDLLAVVHGYGIDETDLERVATLAHAKLSRVGPLPAPEPLEGEGCQPPGVADSDPELVPGLTQLDDMPAGWIEDPPGQCSLIDRDPGTCDDNEEALPEAQSRARTRFLTDRRALWSVVRKYASGEEARRLVEVTAASLASPSECVSRVRDRSYTWRTEAIEHALGDEVVVWRDTTSDVTYWTVMLFDGAVVSEVVYIESFGVSRGSAGRRFDEDALNEMTPIVDRARTKLEFLTSGD
jgi:hypothetical protein